MKLKKNNHLLKYFSSIIITLMFLNTSSIYTYYFPNIGNFLLLISCFFVLILFFCSGNKIIITTFLPVLFSFLILIIFNLLTTTFDSSQLYICLKFTILFLLFNLLIIKTIDLKSVIFSSLKIIAIWSLLNFIIDFTGIIELFPVTNSFRTEWGGYYYLHCFIFLKNYMGTFNAGPFSFIKMHFPFAEAGVSQFFYNFGLIFASFFNIKHRKFWLLIFSLCTIQTFSLIGIFILVVIIFLLLLKEKKFRLLFAFAIILAPVVLFMISDKIGSLSYIERIADYNFIINFSVKNLPFGIGLQGDLYEQYGTEINGIKISGGFYCGLLTPIAMFGFFSILYYIILYNGIRYFFSKNFSSYLKFALAFLVLMTLLTEPLSFSTNILTIIIIGNMKKRALFVPSLATNNCI